MSLSANTLVKAVKQAGVEAIQAQKPMAVCMGEVVSVSPLKICIDQKMTLTSAQLMLTNAVRDFAVDVTANHTDLASGSTEETEKIKVHFALRPGEKVILMRCDGGQKFIVLDRVEVLS